MSQANVSASEQDILYDDFAYASTTFDRAKWWRGGLAGVDGTSARLNESDLTSSALFAGGDFKFAIGGPTASTQGLFGLGDIDDGDPYLVLSDSGSGWRFHVRNGAATYTGPIVATSLAKGDVVVFHWDQAGSSVSINGIVKDSQSVAHPPLMPITLLEWNNTATNGQLVIDSVSYSAGAALPLRPAPPARHAPAHARTLTATLVADAFVDSTRPDTALGGSGSPIHIANCRRHPDLTGAGPTVDTGQLGLLQFSLPPLPAGWRASGARLAGVVAQNHRLYGMPGWAPGRPIELELLGLRVNPNLATVTYAAMRSAQNRGAIADYTASGSVNFTFGAIAESLEVLRFDTSAVPAGSVLQFPDAAGRLLTFVARTISRTEPSTLTLAIGPGHTQAVSGMECDLSFYAKDNAAGKAPLSLVLELEQAP